VEWLNLVTGAERDVESLLHSGERMFNLKRVINLSLGLDPASDSLPDRFLTRKRKQGPAADHLPQMKEMLEEYYRLRGWETSGKIGAKKLKELGLESLASD
jgi:aldehyde:ferredoxin oxidoreductase